MKRKPYYVRAQLADSWSTDRTWTEWLVYRRASAGGDRYVCTASGRATANKIARALNEMEEMS